MQYLRSKQWYLFEQMCFNHEWFCFLMFSGITAWGIVILKLLTE